MAPVTLSCEVAKAHLEMHACCGRHLLKRQASEDSTQAPASMSEMDSDSSSMTGGISPPSKRRRGGDAPIAGQCGLQEFCQVLHQFGLVGEPDYDSKADRLWQLLERLPFARGTRELTVPTLIIAEPAAVPGIKAAVARMQRDASLNGGAALDVTVISGRCPRLPTSEPYKVLINYEPPSSGQEYLRRLGALVKLGASRRSIYSTSPVVYTLLQHRQLKNEGVREVVALLQRAKQSVRARGPPAALVKVSELDSALQIIRSAACDDEDEGDEGNDECDCICCRSNSVSAVSYHGEPHAPPQVEVVRIPLKSLQNLSAAAPFIAPRLPDHSCTIICLHSLFCHTPWDGVEHHFALPKGMGSVRVVLVLATDLSWHDYPDCGTFSGGVAWTDIVDMESMNETDKLLERLQEHEIALLGGKSERLLLMGVSQGGGQAMLRFLRSRQRLGGYLGAVCHAPITPHVPRSVDPLLAGSATTATTESMATATGKDVEAKALTKYDSVNLDRPVRLLAGELDTTFPASLVLRDALRLQTDGGFSNVEVTVQKGLSHEGGDEGNAVPADLRFLHKNIEKMLDSGC